MSAREKLEWISFKDQQPPIYDEDGTVHMLCILNNNVEGIHVTRMINTVYWEKHVKPDYNWTHWLILPPRPSVDLPEEEKNRQALLQRRQEILCGPSASRDSAANSRFCGKKK